MCDRRLLHGLGIALLGLGLMRVAFGPHMREGHGPRHWGHWARHHFAEGQEGERPVPPIPPFAEAMLDQWHRKAHAGDTPQTA